MADQPAPEARSLWPELGRTVRGVADGLSQMREQSGLLPSSASPAMGELVDEGSLAAPPPWGQDPVMAARNLAVALSVAAADHAIAFAEAVERQAPFAVWVAARAVAESCGLIRLLSEEGIGARERVRRAVNERLRSLQDELRAFRPVADLQEEAGTAEERRAALLCSAVELGFSVDKQWVTPAPPNMTSLIADMFDEGLGGFLYHLLSSSAHGRVAGIMRGFAPSAPSGLGPASGNISLRPLEAAILASTVLIAMQEAICRLASYNGWDTANWNQRWQEAASLADEARGQFSPPGQLK